MPREAEKLGCPQMVAQLFALMPPGSKGDRMSTYGGINPYESFRFGFGYIDTIQQQRAVTTTRQQRSTGVERSESTDTLREVMRMREAVKAIRPMMLASDEVQVASPASATSADSLGLNTTPTATTLQSTEEVNTTPT